MVIFYVIEDLSQSESCGNCAIILSHLVILTDKIQTSTVSRVELYKKIVFSIKTEIKTNNQQTD